MLNKIKAVLDKTSKKSNTLLYIIAGLMFLIALIYLAIGLIGILN